jgi:hypothetical protein
VPATTTMSPGAMMAPGAVTQPVLTSPAF